MLHAPMARQPVSKELRLQLQPLIPTFTASTKGGARKLAVSDEAASTVSCSCCIPAFPGQTSHGFKAIRDFVYES